MNDVVVATFGTAALVFVTLDIIPHSNVLCSLKRSAEKSKELVIPLIQKNRWAKPDSETNEKRTTETTGDSESVDAQAVKELIEGENTGEIVQLFNSDDI